MDNREEFTELSDKCGFDISNALLANYVSTRHIKYYQTPVGAWFVWSTAKKIWLSITMDRYIRGTLIELPRITQSLQDNHEKAMSLADGMAWEKENPTPQQPAKTPENSGGSCSYYEKEVYSVALNKVQLVECKDVMTALELNHDEMNIFKEVWRSAAARQGKKKEGHTALRGANKIFFFADENLKRLTQQA